MGSLLSTLARATILDDAAYHEWCERPHLFLRSILLIVVVSLIGGLVSFGVDLVNQIQPFEATQIEAGINEWRELQSRFFPGESDSQFEEYWERTVELMVPMFSELAELETPLPPAVTGFLVALGRWISRPATTIGLWLFYGALVLLFVNLLGGSAKLPDFLGTVALHVIPWRLLGILLPVDCLGWLLAFLGIAWGVVVYVKATTVAADLDAGRAILAVVAPLIALVLLLVLLAIASFVWLAILF